MFVSKGSFLAGPDREDGKTMKYGFDFIRMKFRQSLLKLKKKKKKKSSVTVAG